MYYAVYEGKSKGIYYNWNDCKSQVSGYKNDKYKKFNNFEAAQYFLEHHGQKVVITSLKNIEKAIKGKAGTIITKGN